MRFTDIDINFDITYEVTLDLSLMNGFEVKNDMTNQATDGTRVSNGKIKKYLPGATGGTFLGIFA